MTKHVDCRKGRGRAVTVGAGVVMAVFIVLYALAEGRNSGWVSGVMSFVVLVGAILATWYLNRRDNEFGTLIKGETHDERQRAIAHQAGDLTGRVACVASVLGYLICSFSGYRAQASAFGWMAAICGGTLIISTLVISRRS